MDGNKRQKARVYRVGQHVYRVFRVGQRVYRKVCESDRRRRPVYTYPELKLSNAWLSAAGFQPGDRVTVSLIEPGTLLVRRLAIPGTSTDGLAPRASEGAAPELPMVRL